MPSSLLLTERMKRMMPRFSARRWRPILLCLALLIAGSAAGLAFALHQGTSSPLRPFTQTQPTPTAPPACFPLPQQVDWQHLSVQDLAKYGLPHPPTSFTDLTQWLLLLQHLKHRSCTFSIHPLTRIHPAGQGSMGQQEQRCPPGRACQNPTWAGGIADQRSYQEVEATWNVPCLGQEVKRSSSSAWVGLGGVASNATMVQAGVDTDVSAEGQITYYAWAEAYTPASATTLFHDSQAELIFSQGFHCGDLMYVQVSSDGNGKLDPAYPNTFFVGNLTTGEYQYSNPSWLASDGSTAEWIVEQPTFVDGQAFTLKPLTNFGTLTFAFCLASVEKQGFLTDDVLPLQLVSMKGTTLPLATPAKTSLASIAVQWMRSR